MHKPHLDCVAGALLAACILPFMLFLTLHATVMARSQSLYYTAKYGSLRDDDLAALAALDAAHDLDAANYNVCEHAANRAWSFANLTTGVTQTALREQARLWCDRSLTMNPYLRSMRWMHAQLLAREDPAQGLADWQAYVEWEFWQPENHLILADMALNAHRLDIAEQALPWAEGTTGYTEMVTRIKTERERATHPDVKNGVGNGV